MDARDQLIKTVYEYIALCRATGEHQSAYILAYLNEDKIMDDKDIENAMFDLVFEIDRLKKLSDTLSLKDIDKPVEIISGPIREDFDSWLERYLSQEETTEVRVFEYNTQFLIEPEKPVVKTTQEYTYECITELSIEPERPTVKIINETTLEFVCDFLIEPEKPVVKVIQATPEK